MKRLLPPMLLGLLHAFTWLALVVMVWISALKLTLLIIPESPLKPAWSADSGTKPPPEFLYLMYPATPSTPVFDHPDGHQCGTLTRALANSQNEINSGGWIAFRTPGDPQWVRLSDLRFQPPPASTFNYDLAYSDAQNGLNPSDAISASVVRTQESPTSSLVRFRRRLDDNHYGEYLYRITNSGVQPVEMRRVFGPGEALNDAPRLIIAALVATLSVFFAAFAFRILLRISRVFLINKAEHSRAPAPPVPWGRGPN